MDKTIRASEGAQKPAGISAFVENTISFISGFITFRFYYFSWTSLDGSNNILMFQLFFKERWHNGSYITEGVEISTAY